MLCPYCVQDTIMEMHSRDITLLNKIIMTGDSMHTALQKKWCHASQLSNYHLKSEVSIHFVVSHYTALQIKNYLKSISAIKVATMKNTDNFHHNFHHEGKPSHTTAKSTPFTVSKDEWDTKEGAGKSMKNALYVLRYAKMHLLG